VLKKQADLNDSMKVQSDLEEKLKNDKQFKSRGLDSGFPHLINEKYQKN
jgi:hypothetical protein